MWRRDTAAKTPTPPPRSMARRGRIQIKLGRRAPQPDGAAKDRGALPVPYAASPHPTLADGLRTSPRRSVSVPRSRRNVPPYSPMRRTVVHTSNCSHYTSPSRSQGLSTQQRSSRESTAPLYTSEPPNWSPQRPSLGQLRNGRAAGSGGFITPFAPSTADAGNPQWWQAWLS